MKGRISSFQSLGAVDGPGLRCVVFMQGCPLRCVYCHNPETWDCEGGYEVTVDELISKIERLRPYILEGGGVTVSGGEPLIQHEFVEGLMRALKEKGYHTALDTSCVGNLEGAEKVLAHTDLVIADIKFTNPKDFSRYCQGELEQVLEFLDLTARLEIPLWIRQVIVPGINDNKESICRLKEIASHYKNTERITQLPFKKICESKYDALEIPFYLRDTPECTEEQLATLEKYLY